MFFKLNVFKHSHFDILTVVSKNAPREEKQDPAKMAEQIRFLQRSLEVI